MSNTEALKLAIDTQDAIRNFVGSHGQENTETFLMMEADRALSAVRSALAQPQPSVPSAEPAFDMLAHLNRQAEFSAKTFGPGARVEGVTDHIAKELREVCESGGDLSEWVDVIILAFDGAWRSGASPAQIIDAMVAKQTKNEGRKWPDWRTAPANKAIEHDRSGEVGPTPPPATAPAAPAPTVQPLSEEAMKWRKAVQEAYGWLWHTNNEPMAPVPMWSPEQAAYQARKCLRELLTTAERGEAINAIALRTWTRLPASQQRPRRSER